MTKEDMVQVLRSVGVNENTVTAMCNAFDMGVHYEREAVHKLFDTDLGFCNDPMGQDALNQIEEAIRARGEA